MIKQIPVNSEQIQEGLFVNRYELNAGGVTRVLGGLYASRGYCFYDVTAPVYDEEGNEIASVDVKAEQRQYMQYCSLPIGLAKLSNEELNQRFVSVRAEAGFEIV